MPTFQSDLFTEASDTRLAAHTPTGTGSWTRHAGSQDDASTNDPSVSGTYDEAWGRFTVGTSLAYTAAPANADQGVQANLNVRAASLTAISQSVYLFLRLATSGGTPGSANTYDHYRLQFTCGATPTWYLVRAGSVAILASDTTHNPPSGVSVVQFYAVGTQLRAYLNGVPLFGGPIADSTITAANRGGVGWGDSPSATDPTLGLTLDSVVFIDSAVLPSQPMRQRRSGLMVPGRFVR